MSEIVIRHAEPKDYDAIRQIMPIRRCITTRYRFLILPWKCGRTATDQPGIKHLVACIDDRRRASGA
jgi:putative acetyltransferase